MTTSTLTWPDSVSHLKCVYEGAFTGQQYDILTYYDLTTKHNHTFDICQITACFIRLYTIGIGVLYNSVLNFFKSAGVAWNRHVLRIRMRIQWNLEMWWHNVQVWNRKLAFSPLIADVYIRMFSAAAAAAVQLQRMQVFMDTNHSLFSSVREVEASNPEWDHSLKKLRQRRLVKWPITKSYLKK